MRRGIGRIALALVLSLGTAALAQTRDEVGERLGQLKAPLGGRAYRVTWDGYWNGFVEVTVDAGGNAEMRTGGQDGKPTSVPLQPGDLDGFEHALAHSAFSTTPEHPSRDSCLDECSVFFLTVAAGGSSKTVEQETPYANQIRDMRGRGKSTISDAADELVQIADARGGELRGRPSPWWTLDGAEHPLPAVSAIRSGCDSKDSGCRRERWESQLSALGLSDLWTSSSGESRWRFYRLIWLPSRGSAQAVSVVHEPSHCGIVAVGAMAKQCEEHVRVTTTSGPKPRAIDPVDMERFEAKLYGAGFATMSAEPTSRCADRSAWVLEAYIEERYRYVSGSTCDGLGLDALIDQIRRWGRLH